MTQLIDLRSEVQDRGYDYLTDARIDFFVNRAYQELCESYPWPFLETTYVGPAPATIANLGRVLSVTSPARKEALSYCDRRTLIATYGDLSGAGEATYWYLEDNDLTTYPASTETLAVNYIRVPAKLDADDAEVIVPERFADVIVDLAVIRALKDSDNFEEIAPLRAETDRAIQQMMTALLMRHLDGPSYIIPSGW